VTTPIDIRTSSSPASSSAARYDLVASPLLDDVAGGALEPRQRDVTAIATLPIGNRVHGRAAGGGRRQLLAVAIATTGTDLEHRHHAAAARASSAPAPHRGTPS